MNSIRRDGAITAQRRSRQKCAVPSFYPKGDGDGANAVVALSDDGAQRRSDGASQQAPGLGVKRGISGRAHP